MTITTSFHHTLADIDAAMAERLEGVDWAATPLGPMSDWPPLLRTSLLMILTHPMPQILYWGEALICLHNRAYEQLLSGREPALGRSLPEVWPEAWQDLEALVANVWDGASQMRRQQRFLLMHGGMQQEQWYDLSFSPLMDESGAVLGILNTAIDRSGLVQNQRAMEYQQHHLLLLLSRAGQAMWRLDGSGASLGDAPLWRQETGQTLEEWQRDGWQGAVHPNDRAAAISDWHDCCQQGRECQVECRLRQAAGGWAWRRLVMVPLQEQDDDGGRWLGMSIDIDRHKCAEDEWREKEQRLRLATDAAQLGVFVWQLADDRVIWENERAAALFGMSPESGSMSGQRLLADVLHVEDRPFFETALAEARQQVGPFQGCWRFRSAGDKAFHRLECFGHVEQSGGPDSLRLLCVVDDVSIDWELEQRLQRERDLLQAIFDHIPVMLTVYDPQHALLRMNDHLEQVTGWNVSDFIQGGAMQLAYPDPAYRQEVAAHMDRAAGDFRDIRMRCKDGREIVTSWANIEIAADGRKVGIGLDVDRQRRMEMQREHLLAENRDQRLFLETLLDSAPACIAVMRGMELRYTLINRQYQQLHPDAAMLGRCFGEVFPAAVTSGIEAMLQEVLRSGERHVARGYHFPSPDRPDALWDHEVIRLPGDPEQPSLLVLAWDTTDYHQLTRALRESEERFRNLADNMPQLAWMADATGSIFWYNKRWYDYTGTCLEQVQGWGWQRVHHPEHVERVTAHIQHCWDTGEAWEDIFPMRRHDGDYRWFLSRAKPISDANGHVVRWFGTHTDITQRLLMEQQLRHRTEELAVANRELEAFSYSVSHDLRAPLRLVGLSSDLLELEHAEALDDDARQHLRQIQQGARDMNQLINDMLLLSHVGRQDLQRQPCDLAAIADGILKRLHAAEPWRDVVIDLKGPLQADCDPGLMQLALSNLLSNAWKFTVKRPQTRIVMDAQQQDGETIYRIQDNGAGFAMAKAAKLFEPFQRLHAQTDYRGTGIGLAIVHRVIARHGGRIWAEATEGEGATFSFTLA